VFWIMWLIPAITVVAGLTTLAIALKRGDPPLPAEYHWEGEHLDHDFALARNAAAHGIEVKFTSSAQQGTCSATVRNAPQDSAALTFLFANAADANLDRVVRLPRVAPGQYRGACAPLPPGRWRLSLDDAEGQWSIRTQLAGNIEYFDIRARNPDGSS
jgi:hypothetical protein